MKTPRTKRKRDLPAVLWQDILSRLSIKPILRFRSVSKSWRSMIDDPEFSHLHLRRSSKNRPQTNLLVAPKEVRPEKRRPFKSIKTLELEPDSAFCESCFSLPAPHNRRSWNPLSSIDGLVILVADERGVLFPSSSPKLLLWNPSIRKSRVLPPAPRVPPKLRYVDMGLGFDPLSNDYKHVRIAHLDDGSPQFVAIYTVGLNSWKTVPFQCKGSSSFRWVYLRYCTPCRSRGCLYAIALNQDSRENELVSFDLSNEVFSSTYVPKVVQGLFNVKRQLTVVNDECLFVEHTTMGGFVWTLGSSGTDTDSDSMIWTNRYSVEIIDGAYKLLPFTGGGVEMEEMLQYKFEERLIRFIMGFSFSTVRVFEYFESLMLLK